MKTPSRTTPSFLLLVLLAGCSVTAKEPKQPEYTQFYAKQPRSIVVVPVVNESPEVSAGEVFMSTVSAPLGERGYYVFPVYVTDVLLRDLGLTEPGLIRQMPPQKFNDLFGADAVLFITITDWSTKYIVLQSSVTVSMDYTLVDTRSGEVLWRRSRTVVKSSGGAASGNPIADLIVMSIDAAITALATDYRPLAQQANVTLLAAPGVGLPAGHRSPAYGKDRTTFY